MKIEKNLLRHIIPAALFSLFLAPQLQAQNSAESSLVRLAWTEDTYALRYEVVVEKEAEGVYRRILQEFTDTFFLEISLPPGNYRCRVVPYDFLEKPGEGSQWLDFEVYARVEPPVEIPQPVPELGPPPILIAERRADRNDEQKKEEAIPVVDNDDSKAFDIYLSAAWMPLFPVYGGENVFFGRDFSLAGAALRFGMLYTDMDFLHIGLELAGSWYIFSAVDDANENTQQHAVTAALNLVAQKLLPNEIIAFRFRIGAGLSFLPGSEESVPLGQSIFTNLGVSFVIFPAKHFFIETGFDYIHLFTELPSGCIRPWFGLGWQFY